MNDIEVKPSSIQGLGIFATRPFRAGERIRRVNVVREITCDYNVNITNGTAWPCNCGSSRCRKIVVGDFFLLPEAWQREYRPLLADWFVRRNRDRVEALDRIGMSGHPPEVTQ